MYTCLFTFMHAFLILLLGATHAGTVQEDFPVVWEQHEGLGDGQTLCQEAQRKALLSHQVSGNNSFMCNDK